MKMILVPLDGSELAESVLPYAGEIARRQQAELVLLTAIHWVSTWGEYLTQDPTAEEVALAQAYLDARRKELEAGGLRARTKVDLGLAAEAIIETAATENVDLIAMTTHGRSGIARWVLGSVAEKVLHGTPRPLLLVRASDRAEQRTRPVHIGKILVPLDGSPPSENVLPFAEKLAKALDASLALLHIVSPSDYFGPGLAPVWQGDLLRSLEEQAQEYLGRVAKGIAGRGLKVDTTVGMGFVADEIVRFAGRAEAHLIALSSHGRSGLGRWVMGSVAEAVVQRATLPCLIIRPTKPQQR